MLPHCSRVLCGTCFFFLHPLWSSLIRSSLFTSPRFLMDNISVLIGPLLCFTQFLFFLFQINIKANTTSSAFKLPAFSLLWVFLYVKRQHSLPCESPFSRLWLVLPSQVTQHRAVLGLTCLHVCLHCMAQVSMSKTEHPEHSCPRTAA